MFGDKTALTEQLALSPRRAVAPPNCPCLELFASFKFDSDKQVCDTLDADSVALNSPVLLCDPRYADREKDYGIFDAVADGHGSIPKQPAGGGTIEWSAASPGQRH